MAVEDDQRIAGVGMLVEAFGQQHVGAEVHGPAPELRQSLRRIRSCLMYFVVGGSGIGGMTWSSAMRDRRGLPGSTSSRAACE